MTTLSFPRNEIESGLLTPEHLRQAAHALKTERYVILKEVIQREHAAVLAERMLAGVELILAREDAPFNFNRDNTSKTRPLSPRTCSAMSCSTIW